MKPLYRLIIAIALCVCAAWPAAAAPFKKLDKPPLSESWFGIYVNNDRVGFYRQQFFETADGYRIDTYGSVRFKVMGFSREASVHESYVVGKNLALRTFEVEQAISGVSSRVSGRVGTGVMRVRSENNGKSTEKQLKFKGTEIYPGPTLNLYPLMRDVAPGKSYRILTFDAEEVKLKEVKINVVGEDKTPDGRPALKLGNNLYPFVNNDIWMDDQGNTLMESVREGLVVTKAEGVRELGPFIRNLALSKRDLIYDFSLVRAEPPLAEPKKLTGLAVEISGWNDSLPLLQEGGQQAEKAGEGRIRIRTGSAVPEAATAKPVTAADVYLKPAPRIESDAPEIQAKAKELANGKKDQQEIAKALASWTAMWVRNSVDDGGGAAESLKARSGNCQTHARLYTALARAVGIPTRFVSGMVYLEGKGFLYHSWAESLLGGRWTAVDPTYDQLPADPTHLKMFEGHRTEDMAPIIAIIGKIRIKVLEAKY